MKSNSLVSALLVGVMSLTLASTGCKHKPVGTTQLPNQHPAETGGEIGGNNTPTPPVPPPPYTPGGEGGLTPIPINPTNGIPVSGIDLSKYNQDATAFAANTVHFPFDSSAIKKNEEANLKTVANALKATPANAVQIQGHCDERGTEEYNRTLGERRAEALREALVKLGISADHILTISFGKDKPADPAHNEAAYAKNRRGEFILLTPKAGGGM